MNRTCKNHHREKLIIEFCLIIRELFPEEIVTTNPHENYQKLLLELGEKQRNLTELLSHHLAKLYQNHRIQRKGKLIEIAEEDLLVALKIIEKLEIKEDEKEKKELNKNDRNNYSKLLKHKEKLLTSKEIQTIVEQSKTQTNRLLNLLLEKKLIERYGFKNKGFYYKLIEIRSLETKEKPLNLEEEILQEFSDNQRIEFGYR
jgi:predicted transcriptional regulator